MDVVASMLEAYRQSLEHSSRGIVECKPELRMRNTQEYVLAKKDLSWRADLRGDDGGYMIAFLAGSLTGVSWWTRTPSRAGKNPMVKGTAILASAVCIDSVLISRHLVQGRDGFTCT